MPTGKLNIEVLHISIQLDVPSKGKTLLPPASGRHESHDPVVPCQDNLIALERLMRQGKERPCVLFPM